MTTWQLLHGILTGMPIYRFGDFEIDSRSGELRRHGARRRLRPQPAAVLQYLLERPREVVSRQELRRLLWPDGTFVEFDDGLNSCIKQIRSALGDDRARPTYVETLSRRGYRFVAPVQVSDADAELRIRVATSEKGPVSMKSVALIAGIVLTVLSIATAAFAQAPAQAETVTVLAANKQMYQTIRGYLLASAEKLPEADYAFKPTPEVRSYAAILGHVSNAMFGSCAALKGEPNPNTVNLEDSTARETVVSNLRKAASYCDDAVSGLTDTSATEPVRRGQRNVVRIAPLMILVAHLNEHYGNLVTYMRLKGVVPPSSDKAATPVK